MPKSTDTKSKSSKTRVSKPSPVKQGTKQTAKELKPKTKAIPKKAKSNAQAKVKTSAKVQSLSMPAQDCIRVIGAKENNLKNVSVDIPKNKLVTITGVSGSGKSSLAFNTIFAEGQRRYVESLSTYARQFLGQIDKPDVESIEGLSPAIAIDQKSIHNNPRSTVGTVTEIYDYLRLLYGRIGHMHCPVCGTHVSRQTIDQMIDTIYQKAPQKKSLITSPVITEKKGNFAKELELLKVDGFQRVLVDNELHSLDSEIDLSSNKKHTIELVVDRIVLKEESRSRLADSLSLALNKGNGIATVITLDDEGEFAERILCSQNLACPQGHGSLPELSAKLFSFNSPQGACTECHGLGSHQTFVEHKLIPDPSRPLIQCIEPWAKSTTDYYVQLLTSIAKHYEISHLTPWNKIPAQIQKVILHGTEELMPFRYDSYDGSELISVDAAWDGVIARLQKKYRQAERDKVKEQLSEYMEEIVCKSCSGSRLKPEAMAVTVNKKNIHQITTLPIDQAHKQISLLYKALPEHELFIVTRVLNEITTRLKFLIDVGLGYLSLDRTAGTLSGGEAQRIRLATQIGSGLSGVLYVLDEPSIGLHQRDNDKLISTLKHLRDLGNTVLVVEHDEDTMRESDWIIDVGIGAGKHGGDIITTGTLDKITKSDKSHTAAYLSGREQISIPANPRNGHGTQLTINNAHLNNLQNVNVDIPLGKMIAVTGVSGSGKSSLIMELLYPYLHHKLMKKSRPHSIDEVTGIENIDKVIEIDQAPIGRTPHSNPATYTGAFTPIRELYATMTEAKIRGYTPGHFSFNVKGAGRCEHCQGQGSLEIEMHFLPSVYLKCPVCDGRRYTKEILEVKFKGYNIADTLEMTVSEACEVYKSIPAIYNKLSVLNDVGLGYISLGQSATTLSGGEAQRVKLATELARRQTGQTLYILDEPTTGLHWYDVARLLDVLNRLVDSGNTVLVIEHNLDVIKQADWVIDMGPEGGIGGGQVIATGTPAKIAKSSISHTGKYLAKYFASSIS